MYQAKEMKKVQEPFLDGKAHLGDQTKLLYKLLGEHRSKTKKRKEKFFILKRYLHQTWIMIFNKLSLIACLLYTRCILI